MIKNAQQILLVAALLLLVGCGFQLRGQVDIPDHVAPVLIAGDEPNSQMAIEIRNLLSFNNVATTSNATEAQSQLVIVEQRSDRRTLSVGANASASEYQLIETLTFTVKDGKNNTVLGPKSLVERRIMRNDPNQVVSKGEEEQILRREMLHSLAAKVVRQLTTFEPAISSAEQ